MTVDDAQVSRCWEWTRIDMWLADPLMKGSLALDYVLLRKKAYMHTIYGHFISLYHTTV